ncbi:hypothetical protein [Solibacillus daqui]|uniref:hypothetical protein n=1 Tax=Solibacillus daqui TaxID=2912187 RepID=UPI0023651437|nr:hypothetical protein [Solibacillus daqui]
MKKVDDWDNWEKERKKENWRWILTGVAIIVIFKGYMTYVDFVKYTETTGNKVFEIAVSDYSKDLYTTGRIDFYSEGSTENKEFELSKDDILDILTQLENTSVRGMERADIGALDLRNLYFVELKSKYAETIFFDIGRDKNTQKIFLDVSIVKDDMKLAEIYLVQGEELYNIIEELRKQAP